MTDFRWPADEHTRAAIVVRNARQERQSRLQLPFARGRIEDSRQSAGDSSVAVHVQRSHFDPSRRELDSHYFFEHGCESVGGTSLFKRRDAHGVENDPVLHAIGRNRSEVEACEPRGWIP